MSRDEIVKLLSSIANNYPTFKRNIINDEGKISRSMVDEWYKRLGYMDYEKADKLFEAYLTSADNKYAPGIPYFMGTGKAGEIKPAFTANDIEGWHIDKYGNLLDGEDREYGNTEGESYYYSAEGHICRKSYGREIVVVR